MLEMLGRDANALGGKRVRECATQGWSQGRVGCGQGTVRLKQQLGAPCTRSWALGLSCGLAVG